MQLNEFHRINLSGSYEWIYFDLISEKNDYILVVILYNGFPFYYQYIKNHFEHQEKQIANPLTSIDYPAISFCLYKGNKKIANLHYIFRKDILKTNNNIISYENYAILTKNSEKLYNLHFNLEYPYRKINLNADLRISANNVSEVEYIIGKTSEKHFWKQNFIKYSGSANISLYKENNLKEKISFDGIGYNDQNWGLRPLPADVTNWYWGRFIKENYIFVYLIIEYNSENKFRYYGLFDGNKYIKQSFNFDYKKKESKNYFLLKYNESLKIKDNNFTAENINKIKLDNGPFYIRFLSEFRINSGNIILEGTGISEFIRPPRLIKPLLKPFINLKIKNYQL